MRIVINTPNSNIGRPLTKALLAAGQQVTIISRNPDSVADLTDLGADLVAGSIDTPAVLDQAFAGADALFWLTPPVYQPGYFAWVDQVTAIAATAAKHHGMDRVVVLSSIGAGKGAGSGPIGKLLDVEDAFRAVAAHVTALRPGYFMENLLQELPALASHGTIYTPLPVERPMPFVATHDIGLKAAEILLDPTWTGHPIVGVHGPKDLNWHEVAGILNTALGRPVQAVPVSLDQAKQGMVQAGLPDFLIDLFIPMLGAMGTWTAADVEARTADTTTVTTLADVAQDVIAPAVATFKAPVGAP
jgi:uncharacterized protein YbjT (DUF2867 family)